MCCLFGLIDYGNHFTGRQKSKLLSVLSKECEARGTDATGIAYNHAGRLSIYKRPLPAHHLKFRFSNDSKVVMGHTRLTTQGSEKQNQNNHPFRSRTSDCEFALAHNGVLYNDRHLRSSLSLPHTSIETDSFVAVQLIEQQGALTPNSLKYMAEQVEGTFVFTVLDADDNLYFVKGDNPLCLYHYPKAGFYLYASTDDILKKAIKRMRLPKEKPVRIPLVEGDIVRIDANGDMIASTFSPQQPEYCLWGMQWNRYLGPKLHRIPTPYGGTPDYLRDLKSVACAYGYSPEDIDELLETGFSLDEVEELLYCGEF